MKKRFVIVFSLFAFITGCAAPAVDKGFSLTGHETFEVAPILNETGKTFDSDLTAELAEHIESSLREKGLSMTKTSGNAIIIKSSLTLYEKTGNSVHFSVKSELTDKITQKFLGEMVTTRTIDVGGLMSTELEIDQTILDIVADSIVSGVENRIRMVKD